MMCLAVKIGRQEGKIMKFNIKYILYCIFNKYRNPSDEEIVEILEKLYNMETLDYTFKQEYISVAIENIPYYIRSIEDRMEFADIIYEMNQKALETIEEYPDHDWMTLWHLNNAMLKLFKRYFDEEYFREMSVA